MSLQGIGPLLVNHWGGILPFADNFDRANGTLGGRWQGGANWAIVGNEAVNTPTVGPTELMVNGDMETGNPPTGWAAVRAVGAGSADAHGGAQAYQLTATDDNAYALKSAPASGNSWYQCGAWKKGTNVRLRLYGVGGTAGYLWALDPYSSPAGYTEVIATARTNTGNTDVRALLEVQFNTNVGLFDDVSVKALALADLLTGIATGVANVAVSVEIDTLVAGTQAGVLVSADSLTAPANFVLGVHNGTNAKLIKCVAGVYTDLIDAAAAYGADRIIQVIKNGTSYSLYYNGVQIGATQTIADAGIISNTRHGMFSAYAGNQLDNFSITKN